MALGDFTEYLRAVFLMIYRSILLVPAFWALVSSFPVFQMFSEVSGINPDQPLINLLHQPGFLSFVLDPAKTFYTFRLPVASFTLRRIVEGFLLGALQPANSHTENDVRNICTFSLGCLCSALYIGPSILYIGLQESS